VIYEVTLPEFSYFGGWIIENRKLSLRIMLKSILIGLSTLVCTASIHAARDTVPPSRPNIIYILADDLGYGELGAYGQSKIETPNIDALAREGMRFTDHYSSAPVCAPARYMLLTGQHAGHAYIRNNDEGKARGEVWNYRAMLRDSILEGQRAMPSDTRTLAHHLQAQGYATGVVGKWGLGRPGSESTPNKMGFDFFFGYNCQRQAHTYYPVHLYKNESRVYLRNDTVAPHTPLPEGADPYAPASYAPYQLKDYAPDVMFEEMMGFVEQQQKDQPFFLYWATPIPHVALQAPQRWVDYYVEKFGDELPYTGKGYFPSRYPRATYAAMISYLDENVGKLVAHLKATGQYDNTLIVFTSDNGPTFAGGADPVFFDSAAPFEGTKGRGKAYLYEGGIRVPMIATWLGHIPAGTTAAHPSAHYDFLATVADLLEFEVEEGTDGISFLPTLLQEGLQPEHEALIWAFPGYGGQAAVRMGDWKLLRRHLIDEESPTLELYHLGKDPAEQENIATDHPAVVQQMAALFDKKYRPSDMEKHRILAVEEGLLTE
jgi:arylsulfatase